MKIHDLLLAMGYGGSQEDAGRRLGRTNDGGIDGIIKEDRLGLDNIYLQAKRWINTVGRPEVHHSPRSEGARKPLNQNSAERWRHVTESFSGA